VINSFFEGLLNEGMEGNVSLFTGLDKVVYRSYMSLKKGP